MPAPNLQDVFDSARGWLSDNLVVPAGESYQNAVLQPHFATAYRKMYDAMANLGSFRVRREFYYNLPAYTTLLVPSSIGVVDMAEPDFLMERSTVSIVPITSTGVASPIQILAPDHEYASNSSDVIISGVNGTQAPWGRWFVTVIDDDNFTLNGSISDTLAGTGGFASTGFEKFTDVDFLDRLTDRDISDHLQDVVWEENVLKFRGANQMAQLQMSYWASGNAPTVPGITIGIDNCLTFLSCYTASLACRAKGWYQMADALKDSALGPGADGTKGYLRDFINLQVKKMQRTQRRRGPFRRKRFTTDSWWV